MHINATRMRTQRDHNAKDRFVSQCRLGSIIGCDDCIEKLSMETTQSGRRWYKSMQNKHSIHGQVAPSTLDLRIVTMHFGLRIIIMHSLKSTGYETACVILFHTNDEPRERDGDESRVQQRRAGDEGERVWGPGDEEQAATRGVAGG